MMSRGRFLINSASLPYTAPQYGLLDTATPLDLSGNKWKLGITWEPLCPDVRVTNSECFALQDDGTGNAEPFSGEVAPKQATTEWQIRGATPFTVYSQIDCTPVGVWDELSPRNQQALLRAEAREVEQIFWDGEVPGLPGTMFPHLSAGNEVVDGEDLLQPAASLATLPPQNIKSAIGLLEEQMRFCYPGVATLHVPITLAPLMADANLIEARGGIMRTTTVGSKVVFGSYPGTPPGPQEGTWIFATGEVFYQREAVPHSFRPVESLDRDVNLVSMIAERTYVIGWDCCLIGVPVDDERVTT